MIDKNRWKPLVMTWMETLQCERRWEDKTKRVREVLYNSSKGLKVKTLGESCSMVEAVEMEDWPQPLGQVSCGGQLGHCWHKPWALGSLLTHLSQKEACILLSDLENEWKISYVSNKVGISYARMKLSWLLWEYIFLNQLILVFSATSVFL